MERRHKIGSKDPALKNYRWGTEKIEQLRGSKKWAEKRRMSLVCRGGCFHVSQHCIRSKEEATSIYNAEILKVEGFRIGWGILQKRWWCLDENEKEKLDCEKQKLAWNIWLSRRWRSTHLWLDSVDHDTSRNIRFESEQNQWPSKVD